MASTCDACGGQGISIPRGKECGTCNGNGAVRERRTVSVDIPGGIEDGMRLRVKNEGDAPPTGAAANQDAKTERGDLYVFVRVAADSKFSRAGADVLYTAAIPITTAVLGGEIRIPTLDGEVKVRVPTGTATGERITLSGMGMKKLSSGRRGGNGDLRVEFKVQMPKFLSTNQRAILEMLADDMGDDTAKRVMNIDKSTNRSADKSTSGSKSTDADKKSSTSPSDDPHKNEPFWKKAWHEMTGQHDHTPKTPGTNPPPTEEDEPKKASGSGSG